MSSDESDRGEDNSEDEPIFELSTEWDPRRAQEGQAGTHVAGAGQTDTVAGSHEHESEDSGMDYFNGLPGTTPPHHGRFIKNARKGHKHRGSGTKKLSLGHVPKASYKDKPSLRRRPKSTMTLPHVPQEEGAGPNGERLHQRRHTVHAVKFGRSRHHREKKTSGSSSGGYMSPSPADEKGAKKKRKEEARKRKKDRDEKVSFREPKTSVTSLPSGSDVRTADPLNVPDFGGTIFPIDSTASLTMSLQPPLLRSDRGSGSYHSFRQRRSKSDAHLSLTSFDKQNIKCPPERKQFYRLFLRTLKYSGINSSTRNRMDGSPSGIHVPRQFSENLALENPYGHVFDHIWLELQANLADRSVDEQKEWLFFQSDHIDKILTRIANFELLSDPQRSLNAMFSGVCDREAYESLNTPAPGGSTPPDFQAGDDEATIVPDSATASVTTAAPVSQQESVESKTSGDSITCDCKHEQFLSPLQMIAVRKVKELLEELEKIEALYPSRRRMGDEHPKHRTLVFRRRLETLTLWLKVTLGLADRLCALSAWLGTPVTVPEVCVDNERPRSYSYERPPEPPGITVGSPKSPGVNQSQFQVGSPDDPEQSLSFRSLQRLNSSLCRTQSSSTSSHSQATLQRFFSNYQSASLDDSHGPYHSFIDKGLKKKGLTRLMDMLLHFMKPILLLAQFALTPLSDPDKTDDASTVAREEHLEERRPLLKPYLPIHLTSGDNHQRVAEYVRGTSVSPDSWIQEFEAMNLPLFSVQYIQLVHVPLDVMHECLHLQQVLKPPAQPSAHSVKQLVRECRETLERAIKVREFYRSKIEVITKGRPVKEDQVNTDIESFELELKAVLEVYFDYLQSWVQVSSGHVLEDEWRHVKEICTHIRGGEAEAGRRFCEMASRLVESTGDILETRMDESCHILHKSGECPEKRREAIGESYRRFKELFVDTRERASKALGFAKMLRKDLEIAADFAIQVALSDLLSVLQSSDHVQVVLPNQKGKIMFVPESTAEDLKEINQLLSVTFAHGGPDHHYDLKDSYLLLVAMDPGDSRVAWNGKTVHIKSSAETTIAISEIQVESLKMVVSSSAHLSTCRHSFLAAVGNAVKLKNEQTSSHENVAERIGELKLCACDLAKHLMRTAKEVIDHLSMEDTSSTEDLSLPYQNTMHACFNLGFEYIREVFRLLGDDMAYQELGEGILDYAQLWMRFVLEKCDRGRGTRPRWATTGLDFLTVACAPHTLATISYTSFEALKKLMNRCIDHIIGEAPAPPRQVVHPTPQKIGQVNRKPWRKPPKIGYASRTRSSPCTTVNEEDVYKITQSHFTSNEPIHGLEAVYAMAEAPLKALYPEDPSRPQHDRNMRVNIEDIEAVYKSPMPKSPPMSAESYDSVGSSGHDSPHVQPGDISTVEYLTPNRNPKPVHTSTPPSVERVDSNTSASAFYSSIMRTPSGSSTDSFSAGERIHLIQEKVKLMEKNRDEKLYREKRIGKVKERPSSSLHQIAKLSNLKQTHFKWQRGRKLGEGKFGKVYECLNLDTGEINAVKQVSIQEKDTGAIQTIIDEISVFQKLTHPNLVKFHGVEVHHNELYMFMEYCNEGTLWSIVHQGLSEDMIRHYTRDILQAVYALHDRAIVHRDIKGANIFLTSDGSVKLGDFGLSVQLKNLHKTMPNEIKQQVGTVPYMSPEVILKHEMGRPMDIWSVGCVVVEMATGKLPWSEWDNQFQIMYQLGMGKSPPLPKDVLSPEGEDFLSHCFEVDTNKRWKANKLLDHPFVKVSDEQEEN